MTENTFRILEARTLTLEEAFPTATPETLAELRGKVVGSVGLRVVKVDRKQGIITLEGVRQPKA
jgi:hypothetical protein